jgi:hypothetical protein
MSLPHQSRVVTTCAFRVRVDELPPVRAAMLSVGLER